MNEFDKADMFAEVAHAAVGQVRKYTFEPYITHPRAVSEIVRVYNGTVEMQTAALLHDVVEDTDVTIEMVRAYFSASVADMVDWLTDVSKPEDGNRAVRKAMDKDHLARATYEAQFVKCADMMHNSEYIVERAPSFAVQYLKEKTWLLEAMTKIHGTAIHADAVAQTKRLTAA